MRVSAKLAVCEYPSNSQGKAVIRVRASSTATHKKGAAASACRIDVTGRLIFDVASFEVTGFDVADFDVTGFDAVNFLPATKATRSPTTPWYSPTYRQHRVRASAAAGSGSPP